MGCRLWGRIEADTTERLSSSSSSSSSSKGLNGVFGDKIKNLPAIWETRVGSLGWEDPPGEGNGYPLQYSCLANFMDRGAWWATVHGVTKSQTQLID